jgi:hypothetical protein
MIVRPSLDWSATARHTRHLLAAIALLATSAPAIAQDQPDAESDRAAAQRAARLASMKRLAVQLEMRRAPPDEKASFDLRPDPLFRYSDQPRGFVDATLWAWSPAGATGRPALLTKIEAAITAANERYWHFCVVSLDDDLVTADFEGTRRLTTTKPGLELRKIHGAPEGAQKPAARQRQMKDLAARFTATIYNTNPDTKRPEPQEMRLLATPIHRYADEAAGLWDGTIVGLTTNGTNPDMLLVIELRGDKLSSAEWKFGIVKMTIAEVHVRLDKDEAWMSPRNSPRETWDSFTKMPREE